MEVIDNIKTSINLSWKTLYTKGIRSIHKNPKNPLINSSHSEAFLNVEKLLQSVAFKNTLKELDEIYIDNNKYFQNDLMRYQKTFLESFRIFKYYIYFVEGIEDFSIKDAIDLLIKFFKKFSSNSSEDNETNSICIKIIAFILTLECLYENPDIDSFIRELKDINSIICTESSTLLETIQNSIKIPSYLILKCYDNYIKNIENTKSAINYLKSPVKKACFNNIQITFEDYVERPFTAKAKREIIRNDKDTAQVCTVNLNSLHYDPKIPYIRGDYSSFIFT